MDLTILRRVVPLVAKYCVSQSQRAGGLQGASRLSGRVVSFQLREQPGISLDDVQRR
jgi:hypothetical protein